MQKITNKVKIPLDRPLSRVIVPIKQNDKNARTISFTLTNGGSVFPLDNVRVAAVRGVKADGSKIYNDCLIKDNEIIYEITSQTINIMGLVTCELVLFDDGYKEAATAKFFIEVTPQLFNNSFVESMDEYNLLESIISEATEESIKAKTSATNAKESENAAKASENAAKASENAAKASENLAKASENAAAGYSYNAGQAATYANQIKSQIETEHQEFENDVQDAKKSLDLKKVSILSDITARAETEIDNIDAAGEVIISEAQEASTQAQDSATRAIQEAQAAAVARNRAEAINNQFAQEAQTALTNVENAESDALEAIETKQSQAESAIETKGQTTLDSIPDSYEELEQRVDEAVTVLSDSLEVELPTYEAFLELENNVNSKTQYLDTAITIEEDSEEVELPTYEAFDDLDKRVRFLELSGGAGLIGDHVSIQVVDNIISVKKSYQDKLVNLVLEALPTAESEVY